MVARPAKLVLVSNREPYVHERSAGAIKVKMPPGGVVAAMDPVMRSVGGTWIAWGSGDADREMTDEKGRVEVPPDGPKYTLRRVWLTKKEVDDYYLGFSNRVLWPVCHLFQENARFDRGYWDAYRKVNEKFALAAVEELEGGGALWVHDVHFGLLPSLVREKSPLAEISLFWHIPFPPIEAFACIPWRREIMEGMLQSDLLGFHTKAYAANFLSAVRREFPQASVTGDAVELDGHVTRAKAIPIGIDYSAFSAKGQADGVSRRANRLRRKMGGGRIILGVDRLDYTKGILNRFLAFERFLESNPKYVGKVSFIQVASPSRSLIHEYREMKRQVEEAVGRINGRFQSPDWTPIMYIHRHVPADQLLVLYRSADVAMVTPVIDGMNLVAKEFVAVSQDGVLILSEFAGASEELEDALVVNPYDMDMTALAILRALTMAPEERARRMSSLKNVVKSHDIYWWLDTFFREWGADGRVRDVIKEDAGPLIPLRMN